MAASALGLPSGTGLAAASSSSSSSPTTKARLSSAFCPSKDSSEARRGQFSVSLSAASAGPPCKHIRVSSSYQADTGVAEPSLSFSEASPSTSSSSSPSSSSAAATTESGPPTIDLEFLGLEPGQDGLPIIDKVSVASGEKLLRTVMIEQKLELYGLYGKIMNCGGGGSCGTCIVEVLEGSDLLNERTDAEERYLKKNPSTWRLACQTIVGDKSNYGKVLVQRLPQKKK